jgi:WD40 repeat protein
VQNTPAAVIKMVIGQPSSDDADRVSSLAFSPDGTTLISQTDRGAVNLWNAATNQLIVQLTEGGYFAEGMALSPDGSLLASGSCGKHDSGFPGCDQYQIILWDMVTRQPVGQPLELRFGGPTIPAFLFSRDGKFLAAMQSGLTGSGSVQIFDMATRQPISSPLGDQEQFSGMAFKPNSDWIALGTTDGIIHVWSLESQDVVFNLAGKRGFVRSVAFSPDGSILAAAISGPVEVHNVQLWNMDTLEAAGQPITVQTAAGTIVWLSEIAFSPDGHTLAILDQNGNITLWDVATSHQIGPAFAGQSAGDGVGATTSIAFSPDGTLASGNKDGTITLWEIALP